MSVPLENILLDDKIGHKNKRPMRDYVFKMKQNAFSFFFFLQIVHDTLFVFRFVLQNILCLSSIEFF